MPGRPSPAGGGGAASIDPIKLLHKYKLVLVGSVFIGMVIGVVAHKLLSKFAPVYTAKITFACSPVEESIGDIDVAKVDEVEMERFIGTQVATLKSQLILSKVISDPRLQDLAPKWSSHYVQKGSIDIVDAYKDFEGMVSVSAVPKTYLIRLSVSAGDKNDAAGLVTMVKDAYQGNLDTVYKREIIARRKAIRDSIQATDTQIRDLTAKKIRYVQDERIDSIDSAQSATANLLGLVNGQLLNVVQTIEAMEVIKSNDEAQLQRDTGIEYDSSLREIVEQSPMMQTFKQELKRLETLLVGLQADGIKPDHRQYRQLSNQIDAHKRKLESTREEMLREAFEARVNNTAVSIQQLHAQAEELTQQKTSLEEKLTELTRIGEEIADVDRQIEAKIQQMSLQEIELADLQAASAMTSAQRVSVVEDATVPDLPTFPQWFIMIPAGTIIVVGLTCGLILLFELADQRIKSASDIRSIPRVRPLGIIMDASEDPESPESVHTVFADHPNSVLSEHFRQLRTTITSSMSKADHHSLLVAGTIPQSGATAIITNLASACVATHLKTLIIDANMRKTSDALRSRDRRWPGAW